MDCRVTIELLDTEPENNGVVGGSNPEWGLVDDQSTDGNKGCNETKRSSSTDKENNAAKNVGSSSEQSGDKINRKLSSDKSTDAIEIKTEDSLFKKTPVSEN